MKLKIRYENEMQTIELDSAATEQLWVSLSLEGEGLSQEEREQRIQEAFNEKYNKPDYNCWHKFDRHRGYSKATNDDGEGEVDTSEPLMEEVADDRIFRKEEIEREDRESYEDICQWIREVVVKKPEWADAFIAIYVDGEPVREYADRTGNNENNISQKLKRAKKKLKDAYGNRQI